MTTRRYFLFSSNAVAATGKMLAARQLNERVRIGVIGLHGRGRDHIAGFQGVHNAEVVALCDVDEEILRARAGSFEGRYGTKPQTFTDMRKMFEQKDIDAVSIATPNHWHSLAAIWGCQAGKDVYVEKPGSHNLWEGRQLVKAAHKYDRIVQHGVQLRSSVALQEAVSLLRKGVIGDVYMARGLVYRRRPSIGHKPDAPVPAGLNYDMWQGPAAERAFNPNIVPYNWHWHFEYGNGDIGNQGIHETDMCLWGLGVGLPSQVTAMGGKFLFDDDKETPEQLSVLYRYPEQKKMIQFEVRAWDTNQEQGVTVGNIFYGRDGYLVVKNYDSFEVFLGGHRERGPHGKGGGNHFANFVNAVWSRKTGEQNAPVETAHLSSGLAHLGNLSYRLGRQLQFDPTTERFVGDEQANALLRRQYRAPYVVPEQV